MNETPATLAWLQRVIDESAATAGPAVRRNFIGGGWSMSAAEFVAFWGAGRMAAVSTVSAGGRVHAVPLDVRLVDGVFYLATFPDSQRLRDHRANPPCSITSWTDAYHAVIVYGTARVVDADPVGRTVEVGTEQGYDADAMVTAAVTPTRIYAIRAPAGHHAHRR